MAELSKKLQLTDAQKKQLAPIVEQRDREAKALRTEVLQRFASGVKILTQQKSVVPKCLKIKGRVFGKVATSTSFYARSEKLQHFRSINHSLNCSTKPNRLLNCPERKPLSFVLRKRPVSQHTSPPSLPRKKMLRNFVAFVFLNGNRLSQHENTSQYEFIWNPRSASLREVAYQKGLIPYVPGAKHS
jgi:hypothetical protein